MIDSRDARARRALVISLSLVVSVSYGALFYGFSVLVAEEGAGREFSVGVLSAAYGGAVLSAGVAAVAVGRLSDRAGIRGVVGVGALIGSFGLLAFSASTVSWHILAVWWCFLGPAMAMTLYEPAYIAIQQWFAPEERPRAIALLTLAAGLSGPVFMPATDALVDALGWRDATRVLAVTLGVVGAGAACFAIPSGRGDRGVETDFARERLGVQLSAFARPRLLVFSMGAVLGYGALEANVIHRVARFEEGGIDVSLVTYWAAISGLLTLPGRFLLPVLGRPLGGTRVLAAVLLVMAGATAFMVPGDEFWQMAAYFSLFGLVFGAALPLRAIVMSEWHAVAGFGTILGLQTAMIALSRAGSPPLVGAARDLGGSYTVPMLVLTVAFAVAAALVYISEWLDP